MTNCLFLLAALLLPLLAPAQSAPRPVVLGHAGSGFFTPISPFNFRPPSSWLGIRHALAVGAAGSEVDLQLSQDSVVVLYHDVRLENSSTGRGCVSQHPAAYLTGLRYRGGFPYDLFQHERPITFDALLARFARRPGGFPKLHLDMHEDDDCAPAGQHFARLPAFVRAIAASLARYHVPPGQVLFTTEHEAAVLLAQRYLPAVPIGLEITTADFPTELAFARAHHLTAVVLDADVAPPTHLTAARAAGLKVVLFGGRSGRNLRNILAKRPDEWEADNIKRAVRLARR